MIIGAHNIISSLGWTSEANFSKVIGGESGLTIQSVPHLSDQAFPVSLIEESELAKRICDFPGISLFTKLEQLSILSLTEVIGELDVKSSRTGFIFSTTKGNVELLKEGNDHPDLQLAATAEKIADYCGLVNKPHVVSNACISGLAAFVVAKRFIDAGLYDDVVLLGADILSKFVVSGFQSFQSLSPEPCKPYDVNRDGLSLGEGIASLIISKENKNESSNCIELVNGAIANDANHISGPSRTGEGLYRAIQNAINKGYRVDAISAHGTATPYNDDMESHGISRSGFSDVPVSGLKGYFGHTLGAAGIIESIISIMAMEKNVVIGTKNLMEQGVVENIKLAKENINKPVFGLLKLMSGFGGCNAAVYFKKHV